LTTRPLYAFTARETHGRENDTGSFDMTDKTKFDLIVIGTGPGGEGAAMKAVHEGKSVAAVERYKDVGGGATHWGTIPSKALRRAIYHLRILNESPIYKRLDVAPEFSLPDLLRTTESVVEQQADLRQSFYDRNRIPLIPGTARFCDPHTIEVEYGEGGRRKFNADAVVIATGSRPWRPPEVDFNHPRVRDSDTLLEIKDTPRSLTIYGAGVIGCEYASMLRYMQCDVTLVNTRARLLEFLDDEITDALSYYFSDCGISIMHNEEFERLETFDDRVVLHLKSGKQIPADYFLWCNGRSGNTEALGLDTIGVTPNKRGQLEVNENYQVKLGPSDPTNKDHNVAVHPHIYAVGDVIGWPSLASAAYDQGRFAASHLCGDADYRLVRDIPTGIYTSPEISSLGKTERELTEEKVPYSVGKAMFRTLARAQITGQTQGMLKILFHRETKALLGIHCFGDNAAEIIHIGQAIMYQPPPHNTIDYFIHTTFNYPTMAEAYRVAALRGLDRTY
jgi:NAD(P) transhydrogenase